MIWHLFCLSSESGMLARRGIGSVERHMDIKVWPPKMKENKLKSNMIPGNKIKNKKILFVENSKRIRDALSIFFEFEECNFRSVKRPETALEELQNDAYDIIIADYYLPGLNGLELLNIVKSNYPNTIGVLTTSFGDRKLAEEAKEAGIRDVIQKPFSADTLISHLSQLFEYG